MTTESVCLLAHTRALLQNRPKPLTLSQIALEAGVGVDWLSLILKEPKPGAKDIDPGVKRVQRVYEYLTKQPLLNSDAK